ncbi:MAG: putative baseplate assembly protein [Actinomycetia bacterium]|jgi:predicted phage baseplate assembly protein|nr:putative baseplate assembly protein [Actinomycetes bacterium]
MSLPVPNLDDRRFQDLVDDAKRLVQLQCPEWTDHNVSDPGVTLIELFAWMTDQILYRLNRVPDLHYVKFLDLLGVTLFPPTAARCDLTFWLSAPREDDTVRISAGTEVSSIREDGAEPIVFTTEETLAILATSVEHVAAASAGGAIRRHDEDLVRDVGFRCFADPPVPGDALLVGLATAVPSCAVRLHLDCRVEGIGVDPANPPLGWEAWDGSGWIPCELGRDETGGLNRAGDILVHVPREHQESIVGDALAGWLRCVVQPPERGRPDYDASPQILGVAAVTVGGSVSALHAEIVKGETLGLSTGLAGQRFTLERNPVVPGRETPVLEVLSEEGVEEWTQVTSFADSVADSGHFMLDAGEGELVLGPAVREPDGSLRYFGAVPPRDTLLRLRSYLTGGGPRGNVARGVLTVLHTPIPYVSTVENRRPAAGGVAGEDVENAKVRGPLALRTGDRAVTAEDYRALAKEAGPSFARVECVPVDGKDGAGAVRVLVVPSAETDKGRVRFEQLVPDEMQVAEIAQHLESRRVIGVRISVEPPLYQGITFVAKVRAEGDADPARVRIDALDALYEYFSPLSGGPLAAGWPFGRPVHAAEVFPVLQSVRGMGPIEEVLLFSADPTTGVRSGPLERIELQPHALVFSYEHRVMVIS